MTTTDRRAGALLLVLYLLASAVVAAVAVGAVAGRVMAGRVHPPAPVAVAIVESPPTPIRAEAQVFRTGPAMLAIEPDSPRERAAHPRRLATVRFLRSYPGAPPRIPHNLEAGEFLTLSCKTCHERGGYSQRFAAYVPLTPHPERGICLQCHVGVDSVIGVAAPSPDPNRRCSLCHGLEGGAPRASASLTWPTTVWPALPSLSRGESPPPIPHDLQFRENCLTCHAGPAAVDEIRTTHPGQANCRQCHVVPELDAAAFSRPGGAKAP